MNLQDPQEFRRQWDAIDNPAAIREAFEADQAAEDEQAIKREDDHAQAA